jgi:D-amino-acid oxidase
MLKEVENHEKTISVELAHEYNSLQDMVQDAAQLGCDAVVNCTGTGASTLCGDSTIVSARGVLLNYNRASCKRREFIHDATGEVMVNDAVLMSDEAPWGTDTEACYLIPRGNVLAVGGSYLEGDTFTELRPEERKRLLWNAWNLGIDVEKSDPVAEWTGFRPVRETVRCEVDTSVGEAEGVRVVHNYGHGGSGWTVNVGAAKEVAKLLEDTNRP